MGWVNLSLVLVMIAFAIPLARIDLREHRLPDRLTFGLFGAVFVLVLAGALVSGEWGRFGTAIWAAVAMAAFYGVLALVPGGMGFGDVKLALSIGLVCGWWSWASWLVALSVAFASGSVWALVRLGIGRSLRSHMAFGPAMLLGWGVASIAALA